MVYQSLASKLKVLISYMRHDSSTEFMTNILANLMANKIETIKFFK